MENKKITIRLAAIVLTTVLAFSSCIQEVKVTPEEVKQIAKEAYIYGFPMVMNCKTVYDYAVNTSSPDYKAPFNQKSCEARVYTPDDKTIVTPNSDTPYCMMWLDLRSEPQIISVPEVDEGRYYSFQLIDWYTHNYAYIGTLGNNNVAGKYLIAGPGWNGEKPEGITEVITSESNLVFIVVRTQVFNADDMPNVEEIQGKYNIQSYSTYLGEKAPTPAPTINFPKWVDGSEYTTAAFEYFDFALDQVEKHPDEIELMKKFAKIGLGTSEKFNVVDKDSSFINALTEGMKEALADMKTLTVETAKDPMAGAKSFGTREHLKKSSSHFNQPNFYLQRAVVAQVGIYGNSAEEAIYFGYIFNENQEPYNAALNNYTMKFETNNLPPVNAFWSLSMYDGKTQLFIHNSLSRYLLNSSMASSFIKEDDGSIVLYLQKDSPGKDRESNWLPAPDGPFYTILRMYMPKEQVLNGDWPMPKMKVLK